MKEGKLLSVTTEQSCNRLVITISPLLQICYLAEVHI